jgi:plastocyanin
MEVSFTSSATSFPSLTTTAPSSVTATTASSGGDITDDNGSDITERGVCWSITANPTIADLHTSDGTGKGAFTSNLTGLTEGTKYYVRAYATNSAGTSYGNEVNFTTTSAPGINEVWIQGNAFTPATITVSAGTIIKWTNKDGAAHTVTNDTGEGEIFDSGSMANGATFSRQFNNTGTFKYHCTFHPGMKATVIVN